MDLIDFSDVILSEANGVFTLKNNNTTLGFVRFNNEGEVEYIFVNPIFRKKNLAKKLLKLVRQIIALKCLMLRLGAETG